MKRRTVLKGIILFSLGTGVLYSCEDKYEAIRSLHLDHFLPTNAELDVLEILSEIIVPLQQIPSLENHSPLPFLFTMIDDIYSAKDRDVFLFGYQNFDRIVAEKEGTTFMEMNASAKQEVVARLNEGNDLYGSAINAFYKLVKNESVHYLKTSEYYQRKVNYYEMAPGRFNGDMQLSDLKNANEI